MSSTALLKEEGNKLFTAGKFAEAKEKYTEAIATEAGENAVLYSNRAACSLSLKDYQSTYLDAAKAVELDPKFAKGWARLAVAEQALGNLPASINSWEKAIAALPQHPSAAEQKHKTQYEAALKSVKKAQHQFERRSKSDHNVIAMSNTGDMPWDVAAKMIDQWMKDGNANRTSSAWLIFGAHRDFDAALKMFKSLKRVGSDRAFGSTGAIELFSNGIMMDERCFHVSDPEFIERYNRQLMFEASVTRPWQNGRADEVRREAPLRLEKEGWAKTRPAISLTVRAYLMRGMFVAGMEGNSAQAEQLQGQVVEILTWGSEKWADVPKSEKGAVFTPTFIRGARQMQLENYMQAFCRDPGPGNQPYSLEGLHDFAQEVLKETRENPSDPEVILPPGFDLAFDIYPQAHALTCIGLYHKYCAKYAEKDEDAEDHYRQAAFNYQEASELYSLDDEKHCWFLNAALEMMFRGGAPLSITVPIMEQIRRDAPHIQKLWAHSALQRGGRDIALRRTMDFEQEVQEALSNGELDLDTSVMPSWFGEHRTKRKDQEQVLQH